MANILLTCLNAAVQMCNPIIWKTLNVKIKMWIRTNITKKFKYIKGVQLFFIKGDGENTIKKRWCEIRGWGKGAWEAQRNHKPLGKKYFCSKPWFSPPCCKKKGFFLNLTFPKTKIGKRAWHNRLTNTFERCWPKSFGKIFSQPRHITSYCNSGVTLLENSCFKGFAVYYLVKS